jgi:SIT4-associating protein SAP185/190
MKAIITISANASQNEQSCIGPNDLTRQLVSEKCIQDLMNDMLRGGNPLTVGVGIIIEVIRKNNSDYDPDVAAGAEMPPSSRDPIYLGTLLRMFAQHVPDFMTLILSPTYNVLNEDGTTTVKRRELKAAFGETIEPLGFDRFKTCELMAELLHCSNMGLLNERGSERFVKERDQERERLKAEGKLSMGKEAPSETDFTEDSTSYQRPTTPSLLDSGSPQEIRKLEVANGGEEDGFEDVAASGVLNDEVKDDFDEKPESEDEVKPLAMGTRVGLSEQRKSWDRPAAGEGVDASPLSQEHAPMSPTEAGVTAQIGGLGFDHDNDTIMTGPPSVARDEYGSKDRLLTLKSSDLPDPPQSPLSSVLGQLETANVQDAHRTGLMVDDLSGLKATDGISPHPEDHPAPLFAARAEPKTMDDAGTEDHEVRHGESHERSGSPPEEGDGSLPVPMGEDDIAPEPQIERDVDGSPVVGDFLKMMFVEHRVVPTILVSVTSSIRDPIY